MFRIAILDDQTECIKDIRAITDHTMRELRINCELEEYEKPQELLSDLEKGLYAHIYLLDVELPQMSGLEVARKIRRDYLDAAIIYVTNYVQYAVEAFEVNAYRYIPKNMLREKLPGAYKALYEQYQKETEDYYTIETCQRLERIPRREIYYLIKESKYVLIVHQKGYSRVRATLEDVLSTMNPGEFLLIDRSCAVGIRHIMSLEQRQVALRDGSKLPVSRPRLLEVKRAIMEYWR